MTINQSRPRDFERHFIFGYPADDVAQQIAVIGEIIPGETTIDIGRQKCHPCATAKRFDQQPRYIGLRLSHPCRLRRINRKGGNERQQRLSVGVDIKSFEFAAIGYNIRLLEPTEYRMPLTQNSWFTLNMWPINVRSKFWIKSEVSMCGFGRRLFPSINLVTRGSNMYAKDIGQPKVGARIPRLIIQSAFAGGQQTASSLDKPSNGGNLRIRQSANIRQY